MRLAYSCKWTTIQFAYIMKFKPFWTEWLKIVKNCHCRQKKRKKMSALQSVKQFSKQFLIWGKLHAYAFTSSEAFISMNNTVCRQIYTQKKETRAHWISGCTSNQQQQIFCLTVSLLSISFVSVIETIFTFTNNINKAQIRSKKKPLENWHKRKRKHDIFI